MVAADPQPDTRPRLSPREEMCLGLVLENRSSKEIARELGISQSSVETHVRRARTKLGVRDRYSAALWAAGWRNAPSVQGDGQPGSASESRRRTRGVGAFLQTTTFLERLLLMVLAAGLACMLFGGLLSALAAI